MCTPLTLVIAYIDLVLENKELKEEQQPFIQKIMVKKPAKIPTVKRTIILEELC